MSSSDSDSDAQKMSKKEHIFHIIKNYISTSYTKLNKLIDKRQKICIISTLVHEPKLWVLDEPMIGLDPQAIAEIIALKPALSTGILVSTVLFILPVPSRNVNICEGTVLRKQ